MYDLAGPVEFSTGDILILLLAAALMLSHSPSSEAPLPTFFIDGALASTLRPHGRWGALPSCS
jgi:hypothetical protein